jgi:hypothetical protein
MMRIRSTAFSLKGQHAFGGRYAVGFSSPTVGPTPVPLHSNSGSSADSVNENLTGFRF